MKNLALAILVSLSFSAFAQDAVSVGENASKSQEVCMEDAENTQCDSCKQKCLNVARSQEKSEQNKAKKGDKGSTGSQAVGQ